MRQENEGVRWLQKLQVEEEDDDKIEYYMQTAGSNNIIIAVSWQGQLYYEAGQRTIFIIFRYVIQILN